MSGFQSETIVGKSESDLTLLARPYYVEYGIRDVQSTSMTCTSRNISFQWGKSKPVTFFFLCPFVCRVKVNLFHVLQVAFIPKWYNNCLQYRADLWNTTGIKIIIVTICCSLILVHTKVGIKIQNSHWAFSWNWPIVCPKLFKHAQPNFVQLLSNELASTESPSGWVETDCSP